MKMPGCVPRRVVTTALMVLILGSSGGASQAQGGWTSTQLTPGEKADLPANLVTETRREARRIDITALPDGRIETASQAGGIVAAWYADPTDRYGHAVLGDEIEAGTLRVETTDKKTMSIALPQSEVFEDRTPRLADLDGDGRSEIVTIRSSLTRGAAVTVYGLRGGELVQLASTPFIGTRNRWLNIAGIAPFRGRKGREIAYVQTPHIGGTLFFYAFENGRLRNVGELSGFSNHAIGSREMRLSALADIDGDGRMEIAVPAADRRKLRLIRLGDSGPAEIGAIPLPAPIDRAIAVAGTGRGARFSVGLANGTVHRINRQNGK